MAQKKVKSEDAGGAGAASIAGYDYQVYVSVWLALDLVLRAHWASQVILEPASQEDLEAELSENEPGRVTTGANLDDYTLVVQAKLRTGNAWAVDGLKKLLLHGVNRQSAADRLKQENVRYLLVTSAGLNGLARGLRVQHAGNWPKPAEMPASIKSALPDGAAGRVGVIAVHDEDRLATHIKTLLIESFRVPRSRLTECTAALRHEANLRMRGANGGRWTRAELETLIKTHEGYIASSRELDAYVPPTNWGELVAAMKQRKAALIIGQSGTGKTLATSKLYEELRQTIPDLARVHIMLGPGELSADKTPPPVLYDIEDPWGRVDFDPGRRPWNDLLSRFFANATHDRMIVATSRLDVAQSSKALDTVKPWLVGLEAEHYGRKERHLLYQNRIDALPRELQSLAREAEPKVLGELATPLEIQKFFDALPTIEEDKRVNPAGLVVEAIRRAQQQSIERTVVDQINERKDVRAAAIVWGLLKASGKFTLPMLREIEEKLADQDDAFEEGVERLVSFFVAARNLRQTGTVITYYHPRVETGIELALIDERIIARRALRDLIDVLVERDGEGQEWGVAASARLLVALDDKPDLKPAPSASAQKVLDAYVEREVLKGGKDFEDNLDLAAAAGSASSNVAEAARFLLHRPDRTFPGFSNWEAPEHDEDWYARLIADPNVHKIMDTFVRETLPGVSADYRTKFAREARRLAPDLTPAFLEAASKVVNYGVINTSDAIAAGALDDLAGFEAIVDTAVAVLTPSEKEKEENAKEYLAIENGEYSEYYAERYADNDDGYTASEFLEAYVDRVRRTVGWQTIAGHRHRDRLLYYWFRAVGRDEERKADEVAGVAAAGLGSANEDDMWEVIAKAWDPAFKEMLLKRISDGGGERAARKAALTCLIECLPEEVGPISSAMATEGAGDRLAEFTIDLADLRHARSRFDGARHFEAAERAAGAVPAASRAVLDAIEAMYAKEPVTLAQEGRDLLEGLQTPSADVRVMRLTLDKHVTLQVGDDVQWLLVNATERDDAVEAMEAANRHSLEDVIKAGLQHKYAHVVALALKWIATPLDAPLPDNLLSLAGARGSPVRRELVALLGAKPHAAHLAALVVLAKDKWARGSAYYGEAEDYPIAQAAIVALAKLDLIDEPSAEELWRVAIDTRDPDVRVELFELLSIKVGGDIHERLFEFATNPGRAAVRGAAAHALMMGYAGVSASILEQINAPLLSRAIHRVSARLLLLLSAAGHPAAVIDASRTLATNARRRALLLLVIWTMVERDKEAAQQVARLLPPNHVGVAWAMAGGKGKLADDALNDLGDSESVDQVLMFMQPKKIK